MSARAISAPRRLAGGRRGPTSARSRLSGGRRGLAFAAALALALVASSAPGGGALAPPSASAAFASPRLVSRSATLQADYAYDPVISSDGRYVAFTGSVASVPGLYRKDLGSGVESGALELVAAGQETGAPSISENGRYVSFTTSEEPASGAATKSGCSNVYVRDMTLPITDPKAFLLVSARDGSDEALTYGGSNATDGSCPGGGAAAADRVALSADGQVVAFTLVGTSNLTTPATPPDQIAVRDLETKRTTLVSVTAASLKAGAPAAVPGGAAIASDTFEPNAPVGGSLVSLPISGSTAAISADGTTVAWMGVNIPEQVQGAASAPAPRGDAPAEGFGVDSYAEPLWRRIADGPSAPALRVTGGDDPASSGCPSACVGPLDLEWNPASPNIGSLGPVYGDYIAPEGFAARLSPPFSDILEAITPQLSANGRTVAFLSTAPDTGHDPKFGGGNASSGTANAFVANMSPGLDRSQALTRITEWGSIDFRDFPTTGAIREIAISADGLRVAFTTQRVVFPLAPPALVTPPLSFINPQTQLYEANLSAGTLALVSYGYDGQPADAGVESPAFSGDGGTLAFASAAGNLVYGATNEGSDVFAISENNPPPVLGQQSTTPLPAQAPSQPQWSISATVHAARNGTLLVQASVPAAGLLSVAASPVLPVVRGARTPSVGSTAKRAQARRRSRAHGGVSPASRRHARAHVAQASTETAGPGIVVVRLVPAARYAPLVHIRYGLYAKIELSFTAPGHRVLRVQLAGSFRALATSRRARRASGAPARPRSHGSTRR